MDYAGIEAGKKDCLCRGLKIAQGLPEQGNKYNIPQLKQIKKFSYFINGNARCMLCTHLCQICFEKMITLFHSSS